MDVGPVSLSSTERIQRKDIGKFADVLSLYPVIRFLTLFLASWCSWARKSRDSSLSRFVRATFQVAYGKVRTVIVSKRFFSHSVVVELAIAEMACVSSNVRRTFHVPSGVRVQRSISERDCSHPYFWASIVTNLILMRLPFSSVLCSWPKSSLYLCKVQPA